MVSSDRYNKEKKYAELHKHWKHKEWPEHADHADLYVEKKFHEVGPADHEACHRIELAGFGHLALSVLGWVADSLIMDSFHYFSLFYDFVEL